GGALLELTPREFDLLTQLALARGGIVTREMLAREVWRQRSWTSSMGNVIDVHLSRLREKVDKNQPTRLLHTVRGVGFVLKDSA
ncbi:MAG TPA: winged helix-turn-helix domain-containing protein, partial [Verrucomicrobiae bacterium]